jgi:hypothetical protein
MPDADHVVVIREGRFDQQIRERGLKPDSVVDLTSEAHPH